MPDRNTVSETLRNPHLASVAERLATGKAEPEGEEDACPAFRYLRGLRERALAIEFRLLSGNSVWFPYSWMGPWQHHPGEGVLIKFTGDVVTLVLIRGSNLDAVLEGKGVNLTDQGLQRHRILCVREMDQDELRRVGEKGPTVDRIEIGEFESMADMRAWLQQRAQGFLRPPA